MRHFLIILFIVVVGYALWQMTPVAERNKSLRFIARHGGAMPFINIGAK